MISQPSQQQNNLGSALAMWNAFMNPNQQPGQPSVAPSGSGQPPQLETPKPQNWALSNASQGNAGNAGGITQTTADNPGNLGKTLGAAAGASGGLSGLLSSI